MFDIKDVARFCAERIEGFDLKAELALDALGRHETIDRDFAHEIESNAYEWCERNNFTADCWDEQSSIDVIEIILNS